MEKTAYFSLSELKARGWTDSVIRSQLGAADATRPNPRYRSAAPMRFYLQERVISLEQTDNWKRSQQRSADRSVAAEKATHTKTARLLAYVAELVIEIPTKPLPEVIHLACESYNAYQEDIESERLCSGRHCSEWTPATEYSDERFLQRITVNYLRHELSRYERELSHLFGKVGVRTAYLALSEKVFAAIAVAYPGLTDECKRQMDQKLCRQEERQQSGDHGH